MDSDFFDFWWESFVLEGVFEFADFLVEFVHLGGDVDEVYSGFGDPDVFERVKCGLHLVAQERELCEASTLSSILVID